MSAVSTSFTGRTLGGCQTGYAKITGGYNLPACVFSHESYPLYNQKFINFSKHVIYTVGPVYSGGAKDIKAVQLESCYTTSLDLAVEHGVGSIVCLN